MTTILSLGSRIARTGMRRLYVLVLAAMLGGAFSQAAVVLSLETPGGDAIATVNPGDNLSLRTFLTADAGELTGGVVYTIVMPTANWQMSARDYGTYGWYHNDGLFDNSTPIPALVGFPVEITSDLYDLTPGLPDFLLETSLDPIGSTFSGGIVETFSLVVPASLADGDYQIAFGQLLLYDGDGELLGEVSSQPFTVRVSSTVIPEPTVFTLTLLGSLLCLRRRRSR